MALKISEGDTPESLAYTLLGDTRLTTDLFIPGWKADLPLPVGHLAYIKGNPLGPPAKDWTKPGKHR